jgi:hypothetical protein
MLICKYYTFFLVHLDHSSVLSYEAGLTGKKNLNSKTQIKICSHPSLRNIYNRHRDLSGKHTLRRTVDGSLAAAARKAKIIKLSEANAGTSAWESGGD